MSPGRVAAPSGMFSQVGTRPTTLSGNFISAMAFIVPSTLPAPLMSYFISSMSGAGLMEIPPVSKVMPLPTRTAGLSPFLPPLCSRIINFGGLRLPLETDRNDPMPSFSMSFCSSTSTLRPWVLAILRAASARKAGVHTFGGVLPKSLAKAMPSAMAWPACKPVSTALCSALPFTARAMCLSAALCRSGVPLKLSNR